MCVLIGYKYGGGGYRVWDLRVPGVVKPRDVTFFEEGLPLPTYHDLATRPMDDLGPLPQQPDFAPDKPLSTPAQSSEGARPRLVLKLPGHYMTGAPPRTDTPPDLPVDEALHDMAHVPDFPKMSLHSGQQHEPGGVVDDSLDMAFSAGLLGGIQLSQMPDPHSMQEAMASPDAEGWHDAMDQEMDNIWLHDVFELVPCTSDTHTIRLRWVLHRKFKNGTFDKNKARLVMHGNCQWPGIDYGESFAPVMRLESLHTLLALAASQDFDIIHFDITSAYLHGTLKEEVYVEQPDGYASPGKEWWVWHLKKGLYSLVQVGHTWNEELDGHMGGVGYTATAKDAAVYIKNSWESNDFVAGGYWVDDFVGVGSRSKLNTLAESVDQKYGITGLGDVKWLLGMLIEHDRANRWIYILQEAFINTVLARFNLMNTVPLSTPMIPGSHLSSADCPTSPEEKVEMTDQPYRQLVRALSWLALSTRPDIAFTTASLACFGHNPGRVHWEAVKRMLRYLKGTISWHLRLGGSEPVVAAFTDADWGGDLDDHCSIGAYVLKVGMERLAGSLKNRHVLLCLLQRQSTLLCVRFRRRQSGCWIS